MHLASPTRLEKDVRFLSEIRPFRNYKNQDSLQTIAKYIGEAFNKIGLKPHFQPFVAKEKKYANIIASYQPEKERKLIVGAHYDVYLDQPGADDNASGVALLLETARLLMANKPQPDYGIELAAYCLEEPPFFAKEEMGSFVHAKSLFDSKIPVIGMICYEMVGYYEPMAHPEKHFPPGTQLIFPETSKQFIGIVANRKQMRFHKQFYQAMQSLHPGRSAFVNFPNEARGPYLSDNRNYWKFDYPAVMLNDGPCSGRNPNYHQVTDTADTLNYQVMAEVTESAAKAITLL